MCKSHCGHGTEVCERSLPSTNSGFYRRMHKCSFYRLSIPETSLTTHGCHQKEHKSSLFWEGLRCMSNAKGTDIRSSCRLIIRNHKDAQTTLSISFKLNLRKYFKCYKTQIYPYKFISQMLCCFIHCAIHNTAMKIVF